MRFCIMKNNNIAWFHPFCQSFKKVDHPLEQYLLIAGSILLYDISFFQGPGQRWIRNSIWRPEHPDFFYSGFYSEQIPFFAVPWSFFVNRKGRRRNDEIAVTSNNMALIVNFSDQAGIFFRLMSDSEKCCTDIVPFQHIQYGRGNCFIGPSSKVSAIFFSSVFA